MVKGKIQEMYNRLSHSKSYTELIYLSKNTCDNIGVNKKMVMGKIQNQKCKIGYIYPIVKANAFLKPELRKFIHIKLLNWIQNIHVCNCLTSNFEARA